MCSSRNGRRCWRLGPTSSWLAEVIRCAPYGQLSKVWTCRTSSDPSVRVHITRVVHRWPRGCCWRCRYMGRLRASQSLISLRPSCVRTLRIGGCAAKSACRLIRCPPSWRAQTCTTSATPTTVQPSASSCSTRARRNTRTDSRPRCASDSSAAPFACFRFNPWLRVCPPHIRSNSGSPPVNLHRPRD